MNNEKIRCLVCKKVIKDIHPKTQSVIKLEVSHNIDGVCWDDMETEYICSFRCWNKLAGDKLKC